MKRTILMAAILALSACEGQSSEPTPSPKQKQADEPAAKVPSKSDIAKEVDRGVKDGKKGDPKWEVTYSGDLDGKVEGSILTVVSVASRTTAVGAAMADGSRAKAPQSIRVTQMGTPEKPSASVSLSLPDGTKCRADGKSGLPGMKVLEADPKKFHAEIDGTLKCGDAKEKTIKFKAVLKRDA